MAAALAAVKPLSMTFLSACGSASMAAAAISSASSATVMRPRYGQRNGSSARSGFSERATGLSEVERAEVDRAEIELPDAGGEVLTELEFAQVQFPPHAEIAGQAVERKAEGGRLVAFEQEVTEP